MSRDDAELVKQVMATCPNDVEMHKWISSEFAAMHYIQSALHSILGLEQESLEEHQANLESYQRQRREVQTKCKHWQSTFHPDAAGGSDSETVYNFCGKVL